MARDYFNEPGHPYDLVVSWGRDQEEVQIASVCEEVPTGFDRVMEFVNGWLTAAGRDAIDVGALKKDLAERNNGAIPGFDGWYVGLRSRRTINRLIQTLKRARDQAMGRDE